MEEILDELATEFPQDFYKDLNGGIVLMPEKKLHKDSVVKEIGRASGRERV